MTLPILPDEAIITALAFVTIPSDTHVEVGHLVVYPSALLQVANGASMEVFGDVHMLDQSELYLETDAYVFVSGTWDSEENSLLRLDDAELRVPNGVIELKARDQEIYFENGESGEREKQKRAIEFDSCC